MAAKAKGKSVNIGIDLDAMAAESTATPFYFKFDGETWELPARPDIRALSHLVDGNVRRCFMIWLGEEQGNRLDAVKAVFDTAQFESLLDAYFEHAGIDLGKALHSMRS